MKIYQNEELKKLYIDEEIKNEWKERDFVAYVREYMGKAKQKILAIGGLRGTGKTTGLLQAIKDLDACYIISQQNEKETSEDYIEFLKKTEKKYIVIDEYSWIRERSYLDKYLYTAIQDGKRIAITGTESITLDFLNYGDLIHRVDMVHCTLFSYSEYCRLNNLELCKASCEEYLKFGGTFSEYAIKNFETMKNYIKTAIIDNLVAYTQMPTDKATAIVYSILYKAVCPSNLRSVPVLTKNHLSVSNFLDEFGVDSDINFTENELKRVKDILEQVGVIITVPNWDGDSSDYRIYIVNPSITSQLILTAYNIPEIDRYILGEVYEASVMSHLYFNKLSTDNIYYLETTDGNNKELDIVVTQPNGKSVYLFECKLKQGATLSSKATILSDAIEDFFPNGDIEARYVIYTGQECIKTIGDKTIIFTPLNEIVQNYYCIDYNMQLIQNQTHQNQEDKELIDYLSTEVEKEMNIFEKVIKEDDNIEDNNEEYSESETEIDDYDEMDI